MALPSPTFLQRLKRFCPTTNNSVARMDPKETVRLLDELEPLGFTDHAFHALHHFGNDATIRRHRAYCEDHDSFRADGNNELVQKRLRMVLAAYKAGGFRSGKPEVFVALAEATFREIPRSEKSSVCAWELICPGLHAAQPMYI
jgi:hypothetical protein